jgi:hypothetical protein
MPRVSVQEQFEAALAGLSRQHTTEPDPDAYVEVWQVRDENHWEHHDPREDLAIAPDLEWSDELKRLALACYRDGYDKFLEDGEYYVLVWPPTGRLWDSGDWYYEDPEACSAHEADGIREDCSECMTIREPPVLTPAIWQWTVEVQTWRTYEQPDGQRRPVEVIHDDLPVGVDTWDFHSKVDPRGIWYGRRVWG